VIGFEVRAGAAALTAFVAFLALGALVSRRPPTPIDVIGTSLRARGMRLAVLLTLTGRSAPLSAFSALAILVFLVLRLPLWIPVTLILSQMLSQGVAHGFKMLFNRPRPIDWLVRRERGQSYPSGHAATTVTFFAAWAVVVALEPIPFGVKAAVCSVLALWMLGIDWSRIALAAHYVSDVIGGSLFGIAWISTLLALLHHFGLVG
jgi:undecaprenyl-diphosphatase